MINLKNILITGANRGIGFELVKESIAKGYSVVGTFRNKHLTATGSKIIGEKLAYDINTAIKWYFFLIDFGEPYRIRTCDKLIKSFECLKLENTGKFLNYDGTLMNF